MVYRRTHQVVRRLAARRNAILQAAREAAAEGGMAAVQIAPVASRANVAAGTVYRYFPSKADLLSELIADVAHAEAEAIRHAAEAAPGPSSALAAAVTTCRACGSLHKLAWGVLAEPVDVDVTASRWPAARDRGGDRSADRGGDAGPGTASQDTALAATAVLGALHERRSAPLAPQSDDPSSCATRAKRDAVALRAVGVLDARARGLWCRLRSRSSWRRSWQLTPAE